MSSENTAVVVRLRLPCADEKTFIRHYAPLTFDGHLYIPTRKAQPKGARIRFELLTKDGERLMLGEGEVAHSDGPDGRPGYRVKVARLHPGSRKIWSKLRGVAQKLKSGSEVAARTADELVTDPGGQAFEPTDSDHTGRVDAGATSVQRSPKRRSSRDVYGFDVEGKPTGSQVDARLPSPVDDGAEADETDVVDVRALPTADGSDPSEERTASTTSPIPERKNEILVPWDPEEVDLEPRSEASLEADARHSTLVGVFSGSVSATDGVIIGIDLGTCRSLAAISDGESARIVPLEDQLRGIPSVVASGEGKQLLVGLSAQSRRLSQPSQTVFGSKRLLGRKFHSPVTRACAEVLPYELIPDEKGGVAVKLDRLVLTITEITARLLGVIRTGVELQLGRDVTRAVISVPAYFGDAQREAVREAGLLAGLEVMRIVSEPTAAALAFGYGRGLAMKRLVVYDLGGGTFDVSVLNVSGDQFEVVATGGDSFLGGMDFDLRIVRELLLTMVRAGGPDEPGPEVLERLLDEAERAKISLSTEESYTVILDDLWVDTDGPQGIELEITRDELDSWCGELVERTTEITLAVLEDRGLAPDQIDEVLLVGAQSRMPLVQDEMRAIFGSAVRKDVDPDQAVALGCALLAGSIQSAADPKAPALELLDVLSLSIGLGLPDGRVVPVIEHNTRIPCERTIRVATSRDGQESIEVVVFQGNVRYSRDADYLGTITFVDLPERPAGEVALILGFALDEEGLLSVQAVDENGGHPIERVLSTADSPEEVRRRLGRLDTVIRDLAAPGGAFDEEEDTGLWRGLRRRLFGGE